MGKNTIKILIIEDDSLQADTFKALLVSTQGANFMVECAGGLATGMDLAAHTPFDVILLDLNLPDSEGIETVRTTVRQASDAAVVVLSGINDEKTAVLSLQYGAQDYLVKGTIDNALLIRSIRYAVERKRIQDNLKQQGQFLHDIVESIPFPFLVISTENRSVKLANSVASKGGDWSHAYCHAVVHSSDKPCGEDNHPCPLQAVKETGKTVVVEHRYPDQVGNTKFFEIHGYPVFDGNGQIPLMIEYVVDITERQQAAEKLKTTQATILQQDKLASIGQLAAGVAHEINNPIGFIASNLSTLEKYIARLTDFFEAQTKVLAASQDQAGREHLASLRKKLKLDYITQDSINLIQESLEGADRVKKIVQDLKSFSRVDQAEHRHADINQCLESTVNIVWNELKYKAVLQKEYGELPSIKCFPQQLNQVFMNLLVNAAQAIEKQGAITIRTWHENNAVYISIADTGCGIPREHIGRLFEPFFTTKPVGKGTGLGLSIAYDIVATKHHGEITVHSEVGKGTTFVVKIPAEEGE